MSVCAESFSLHNAKCVLSSILHLFLYIVLLKINLEHLFCNNESVLRLRNDAARDKVSGS